jgi:hypothetical protein
MRLFFNRCQGEKPVSCGALFGEFAGMGWFIKKRLVNETTSSSWCELSGGGECEVFVLLQGAMGGQPTVNRRNTPGAPFALNILENRQSAGLNSRQYMYASHLASF